MLANANDFIQNKIPDGGMPSEVVTLTGFKKPLDVEVKGLTTEEQLHILRTSTVVYPPAEPGGESMTGVDAYTVTAKQIIAAAVSIDFRSRDLQKAFGAKSQEDLVYKMLNDADKELIIRTLTDLSQEAPKSMGTPADDVETAKK